VGEQRAAHTFIKTLGEACPADNDLYALGGVFLSTGRTGFLGAVFDGDIDGAERYLDAIEDRVLQLKREAQP
jgi:hypothetical protein